jgi:lysophospholipase L1-like esterase
VALGDSLALPRDSSEDLVLWEETWPRLLESELGAAGINAEVINCGRRERTADTLLEDFQEHVRLKRPQIVVLQIGVVDGAPRIFSRFEHEFLNGLARTCRVCHVVVKLIIRRRSARRARITAQKPLAKVYTPPRTFAAHLREFSRRLSELPQGPHVIVLPVMSDLDAMERKSPGYAANADLYNGMLREFCAETGAAFVGPECIFAHTPSASLFCSDGYHLSAAGGLAVAGAVRDAVLSSLEPEEAPVRKAESGRLSRPASVPKFEPQELPVRKAA